MSTLFVAAFCLLKQISSCIEQLVLICPVLYICCTLTSCTRVSYNRIALRMLHDCCHHIWKQNFQMLYLFGNLFASNVCFVPLFCKPFTPEWRHYAQWVHIKFAGEIIEEPRLWANASVTVKSMLLLLRSLYSISAAVTHNSVQV